MKAFIILSFFITALVWSDVSAKKTFRTDNEILAAIIHAECSNCSDTEKYLVGSVVINRCNHPSYPKEIRKVIYQKNQFHGINSKLFRPTKKTLKIADDLLNGIYITPKILFFATYSSHEPFEKVLVYGHHHKFGN